MVPGPNSSAGMNPGVKLPQTNEPLLGSATSFMAFALPELLYA
jgi:hypothetical protein